MNIIRTIGFLFILFYSQTGHAQLPKQASNPSLNELDFFVNVNNSEYANIEGSPYLFEDFIPCKINQVNETQLVRFNLAKNRIEIKTKENSVMGLSQTNPYTILLLDGSARKYETLKYLNDNKKEVVSFFEVVKKANNYSLYKKDKIKFVAAKPEKSSYEPAVPAKFLKQDPALFVTDFANKTEYLIEIPKKKRKFFDLFGGKRKAIESYFKKQKLKVEKEQDISKILDFYFTLK